MNILNLRLFLDHSSPMQRRFEVFVEIDGRKKPLEEIRYKDGIAILSAVRTSKPKPKKHPWNQNMQVEMDKGNEEC